MPVFSRFARHRVGCWLVTDVAGRTLSVVIGTPNVSEPQNTDNVLEVIDPNDSQPYDFTWTSADSPGATYDEPTSIESVNDATEDTTFQWEWDALPDDLTDIETANPADLGEEIEYDDYGEVTSVTDPSEANTTTYSYDETPSGCAPCLASADSVTTTVDYPDGEVDVDKYTEGVLQSTTFGTSPNEQTVSYSVTYPSYPTDQDDPITETFTGPAEDQTTTALTNAVGNLVQLTDTDGDVFTSVYNTSNNFDDLCWTAPGAYSSPTCGSPPSGDVANVRIPDVFVHPFRSIPYTDSGVFVHP